MAGKFLNWSRKERISSKALSARSQMCDKSQSSKVTGQFLVGSSLWGVVTLLVPLFLSAPEASQSCWKGKSINWSCKICSYLRIALGGILWVTVQTIHNLREERILFFSFANKLRQVLGKTLWLQFVGWKVSDLIMKFIEGLLCSVFASSAKLRHKEERGKLPHDWEGNWGAGNRFSFFSDKIFLFLVSGVEDMVEGAVWESHKGF